MNDPAAVPAEQLESLVARLADEFMERHARGEHPSVEEYAGRHPEHASVIREVLACLRMVRASSPGAGSMAGPAGEPEVLGSLGDFRLLREIGRGGMGVVYEAEQVSLGRRVALKVLPFAAALDARHLHRFKNEAHAAAQLHHTNIVPVYAVGCERNVHFYAMQFIDGRTLADFIRELREQTRPPAPAAPVHDQSAPPHPAGAAADTAAPAVGALSTERSARGTAFFRSAARLGVQAAEALEYAHQHGVIHRDVKPANLLVDGGGNLWVADFGLAQVQGDARLTMTGDLLGTLRYMSPEQALGQRDQADHRADVYSLGITLYELLTLEPAFGGHDRKQLIRQIAFEEPRAPRKINRGVPAELETIVLKAMAKNPVERYATAQELADDLRRFLDDRTILAKRPGIGLRLRKWARRHRPVVWAVVAVGLVTLIVGGAAGGWYLSEREAQRRAHFNDVEARWAEARALGAEAAKVRDKPAQWHALLTGARAALDRAEGVLEDREAQAPPDLLARVRELRTTLDAEELDRQLLAEVEEIRQQESLLVADSRRRVFGTKAIRDRYVRAFDRYGIRVGEAPPDEVGARVRARPVAAYLVTALDGWSRLVRADDEKKWLHQLLAAADPDPWRSEVRAVLLRGDREALKRLSEEAVVGDQPARSLLLVSSVLLLDGSREGVARAGALLERAYVSHPADYGIVSLLADALYASDPPRMDEALRYYTAAAALRPESPWVWVGLGHVLRGTRRPGESAAAYRKAIELKPDFAAAHTGLGATLREQKQFDAALAAHRKAIELDPVDPHAHNSLGVTLETLGKRDDAVTAFRKAVDLKPDFAQAHSNLGGTLCEQGKWDDAATACLKAIAIDKRLANAHFHLGNARLYQKKYDGAVLAYRGAVELEPDYAKAHVGLGTALRLLNQHGPAVAEFDLAIRYDPNDYKSHRNRAASLNDLGYLDEAIAGNREANRLDPGSALGQYNLANALREKGALGDAIYCYRVALRLQPDYAEAYWNLGQTLKRKGEFRDALATLKRADEIGSRRPNWAPGWAPLIREAERLVELDRRLPAVLKGEQAPADANEQLEFAVCLTYKGQRLAAAQLFKQAFTVQKSPSIVHAVHAAGAAALAGCGQGAGAGDLPDAERARWRRQALTWLRSVVGVWTKQLDSENPQTRAGSLRTLRRLRYQAEFAGVRDSGALAKLPDTESVPWRLFWDELDRVLATADAAAVNTPSK